MTQTQTAENFYIFISTLNASDKNWSGRFIPFKECLKELELLYEDYMFGHFDPWLSVEHKRLDPHNPNDWIEVKCVAAQDDGTGIIFSHIPKFGFDTRSNISNFSIKSPFFLIDWDGVIPRENQRAFQELSYKFWYKRYKEEVKK